MTEQVKLCKDCKYYIAKTDYHSARCEASTVETKWQDIITGAYHNTAEVKDCWEMRYGTGCGQEARLFEPIPPGLFKRLWSKLFGKESQQ